MGILEIALGTVAAAALAGGVAVVGAAKHLREVERDTAGHF